MDLYNSTTKEVNSVIKKLPTRKAQNQKASLVTSIKHLNVKSFSNLNKKYMKKEHFLSHSVR